jgi:polysaccharide biosynthesis/export protein
VSFQSSICCACIACLLASCGFKQNIMFQTTPATKLSTLASNAEKNYLVQRNDLLELQVYSNRGESLVDPRVDPTTNQTPAREQGEVGARPTYLVDQNGVVKFPRIDPIKIEGLTIRQAEEILEKQYESLFVESFVLLKFANKRVIVLGSPGGQVIPLTNENTRLTEVLALARGVGNDAKAQNIRVIRGDEIMVADFSTFEGYQKNNIVIQSGDIVYIEPVRRPFSEGFREYAPLISMVTSMSALVVVIISQTREEDNTPN